ncbi:D-alanyl-D-alanine carboxypeptidase family protein [Bacillus sp. 2205SS5-2]|uniref:D-alanyl-D-alanine carboxypeptidase family protein n=1 Tax=Bacillus sp. 2205SS5-2 TaxID=3109031 RepID=UPI003FA5CF0D
MKRIFWSILISIFLLAMVTSPVSAQPGVSAQGAVLMDQESGRVLFEKNAHTQMRIASITKIMTAILAIESDKLQETVKVSNNAVRTEGSSVYLQLGEEISLEHLVYGLMLRSGNDAAVAIAEHVGGSLDGFVYLMNEKAVEIGMINTHFANPHGLDDHENHLSSAYDMAVLMKYAMNNETFQKISGTEVHKAPKPDSQWNRSWHNKNRLLTQLYEYCTGGKTGYTKRAKRTLVTTASKEGEHLIAVTLDGPDDWNDHIGMYEFGFKNFDYMQVLKEGKVAAIKDKMYKGNVYLKESLSLSLTKEEEENVQVDYKIIQPKDEWDSENAPKVIGKANVYVDQKLIHSVPIYFKSSHLSREPWWKVWKHLFFISIGVENNG